MSTSTIHKKPTDFIDHVRSDRTGEVHSGLMTREGTVASRRGYAEHWPLCSDARIQHQPHELTAHGLTHLSGDKQYMNATLYCGAMSASSRENAMALGRHHESKGGEFGWNCGSHGYDGEKGTAALADHFNTYAKSLRRR